MSPIKSTNMTDLNIVIILLYRHWRLLSVWSNHSHLTVVAAAILMIMITDCLSSQGKTNTLPNIYPEKECPWDNTKLHLLVRLQFQDSREYVILLHSNYYQVHWPRVELPVRVWSMGHVDLCKNYPLLRNINKTYKQ